MTDHCVT